MCYFPPKSTLRACVTEWTYVALNRRIKKSKVAVTTERGKKWPRIFRSTREILGFFLWAHSRPKNGLFFLCVISIMLDALRFNSINNKVNDYHMCPVINLFLPWQKLSCSFLHWSSNSSSSQTKFWGKIAKPFQYGNSAIWPLPNSGDSHYPHSNHSRFQNPVLWLSFPSTFRTKLAQSVSVLL